jgi:twitching motility protein PilT
LAPSTDGGRVPVCEVLRMTGRVRNNIVNAKETIELASVISEGGYDGMQTFDQALYEHVTAGRVSLEDAIIASSSPHDFKLLVDAGGRRGTTMADLGGTS